MSSHAPSPCDSAHPSRGRRSAVASALALGLTSLFPATGALAQSTTPNNYAISILGGAAQFSASRVVCGELNGTALKDFAVLRGDRLTFGYDPALGETSGDIEGSFTDVAGYRGLNPNAADGLLVTGSSQSLSRLHWQESTTTFAVESIFPQSSSDYQALSGLVRLDVGQIDGALSDDVVVVRADRRSMRLIYGLENGAFQLATQQEFSASLPANVVDICLVDGAGLGASRIFAFTSTELFVYDMAGQLVQGYAFDGLVIAAETVGTGVGVQENCAVIVEQTNGKRRLYVLNGQTVGLQQMVDVSEWAPTQISAGDYNGDGATDLAVTTGPYLGRLICMLQLGGGFSTSPGSTITMSSPSAPPLAPRTAVVITDIEGDGDNDVIYPVASRDEVFIAKNDHIDHRLFAPRILDTGVPHVWSPVGEAIQVRFEWDHSSAFQGGTPGGLPQGATHLQIMLWASLQVGAGEYETQPLPLDDVALTLASHPPLTHPAAPVPYVERDFDPYATINPARDFAFVTARFVRLDSSGAIETAWPHGTKYLVSNQNPAGQDYLDQLPFTNSGLSYFNYDPFNPALGGTEVGGGGATGCVPDYPPNTPPPQNPPPVPVP